MDLRVKIPVFEGPFDLLLHLLKVNEMDIYDIRIAEITHQYMQYLTAMEELNLEIAGEYLVMAATLLNIKSRQILPAQPIDDEELEDEIDEMMSAQELIKRLVEYREIKDMSQDLRDREKAFTNVFFRTTPAPISMEDQPPVEMREDMQLIFDAFVRVLRQLELRRDHVVGRDTYKVEDKIELIGDMLRARKTVNIFDLFKQCEEKQEMIVTLIAMLELCKLGRICVRQENHFKEIFIESAPPRDDAGIDAGDSSGGGGDEEVESDAPDNPDAKERPAN